MYALIAESEGGSFPLAHLVAETHTVPTLIHFPAQLSRHYKLVTKVPFSPPRVVMDLSWALLHAVSESLAKTTLRSYLRACWESVAGGAAPPDMVISLCGAHISHSLSRDLRAKGLKK